jgi:hypothetical protein
MYDQIVMLLSFVYAIAMTHLLSSTNDLVLARSRVRFSGLMALWMANALFLLLVNWLSIGGLSTVKHWSPAEVLLQFGGTVIQYFTCATLAIKVPEEGPVDMPAFFERHRPVILVSFVGVGATALIENYLYRNDLGLLAGTWMVADALIGIGLVAIGIAAWTRRLWLQWAVGLVIFALETFFLISYTIPA